MLCFLVSLIPRRHSSSWPSCSGNPSFWHLMLADKQPQCSSMDSIDSLQLWSQQVFGIWDVNGHWNGIEILILHCSDGKKHIIWKSWDTGSRWQCDKEEEENCKVRSLMLVMAQWQSNSDLYLLCSVMYMLCNISRFAGLLLSNTLSLFLVSMIS